MNARELLANASPRPWRTNEFVYWSANSSKLDADDALLVQAVNEFEALLDLEAATRFIDDHAQQMPEDLDADSWEELNLAFTRKRMALARLDGIRGQQ